MDINIPLCIAVWFVPGLVFSLVFIYLDFRNISPEILKDREYTEYFWSGFLITLAGPVLLVYFILACVLAGLFLLPPIILEKTHKKLYKGE